MIRARPTSLATAVLAVALAASCGSAFAYFTGGGTGSASAAVGEMEPPAIASVSAGHGGLVTLAWSPSPSPGAGPVSYRVLRDGREPAGDCPTASSPQAVLGCTDSGVAAGSHEYVVLAVYRTWTATSAPATVGVKSGGAAHLVVAASTSTPAAAAATRLTITAEDEDGNTLTSYTGSHKLVFSGASPSPDGTEPVVVEKSGTAVPFGSPTALTFKKGVATASSRKNGLMKLYDAGLAEIGVSEGTIESEVPLAVTVSAGSASSLSLAAANPTPAAGEPDDLTISAVDAYGNVAGTYQGTKAVTFSGPGASPGGSAATIADAAGNAIAIGGPTWLEFVAGVATASSGANGTARFYRAGTTALEATQGSLDTRGALTLTVSPAATRSLSLAASETDPEANDGVDLKLSLADEYGNADPSYGGPKEITFSGAQASPGGVAPTVVDDDGAQVPFGTPTELTFEGGVASVSGGANGLLRLTAAGTAEVVATDGALSTAPLAFTVSAGTAERVAFTDVATSAGSLAEGCYFACTLTSLGDGGTLAARAMITDEVGNVLSAERGRGVWVRTTGSHGSTLTGASLSFPSRGPAISTSPFTYTAPGWGSYSNTISASSSGLIAATISASG
jgi:hypothetical protein